MNLPLLATNGVSYANAADREILDVFTCIKNKRQLATGGHLLCANAERHVRTPERMAQIFADVTEAIANTVELSSRLQFMLKDLGYQFPSYPVPTGETMDSFLYARTWEGARRKYQPITDRVTAQLERELKLVAQEVLPGSEPLTFQALDPLSVHERLACVDGAAVIEQREGREFAVTLSTRTALRAVCTAA